MWCFHKAEVPRALPDYIDNPAERPFVGGIGIMQRLPAVAARKILEVADGSA
jgi:hypothetical protein